MNKWLYGETGNSIPTSWCKYCGGATQALNAGDTSISIWNYVDCSHKIGENQNTEVGYLYCKEGPDPAFDDQFEVP